MLGIIICQMINFSHYFIYFRTESFNGMMRCESDKGHLTPSSEIGSCWLKISFQVVKENVGLQSLLIS